MAIPMRYAPRRAHVPYWWILATVATAFIALGPIVAALFAAIGGSGGTTTAFASAPAGNYAVVAKPSADADTLYVVSPRGGEPIEIARISHLPGYLSYGAVSPDGRRVALVSADGGSRAQPTASLVVVELETGKVTRIATGLDYLQTPLWAPDGAGVVVARSSGGGSGGTDVALLRVPLDRAAHTELARAEGVAGAYPVGFDSDGRLVHVAIEERGSVAYAGDVKEVVLSSGITRDWRLSPDGNSIAFIETSTVDGVEYFARIVALDPRQAGQLSAENAQALGVAWKPGAGGATFGVEPAASNDDSARALTAPGFDVPLAYTPDGSALAVQHWTGPSFAQPGEGSFEVMGSDGTRISLSGYGRFYGWAVR